MPNYIESNIENKANDTVVHEVVDFIEDAAPAADVVGYEEPMVEEEVNYAEPLPGSDFIPPQKNKVEEPVQTDWANDRDPAHFVNYLMDLYPGKIPQHNGHSIVGCERAYNFLNRLNKEISEAIRSDIENNLDTDILEDVRVRMMNNMTALKDRIGDLKKKHKDNNRKASDVMNVPWKDGSGNDVDLTKEATTPIVQTIATPFQRAIVGMLINSVVSGGKPFEDVYEYLKDKYKFDDRDELSILQLAMDSGFPIFKDRGLIGGGKGVVSGQGESHGVDY